VLALSLPGLHRFGKNAAAVVLVSLVMFGNLFVVAALGLASDLHIYFTIAGGAMVFLFGVEQWRLFLVCFLMMTAALLFAINFAPVDGFVMPEDGDLRDMLSRHAMINTIAINAAIVFFLAGLLVDDLHRQADLAALVEAEQLDLHLVAFLDDVGGLGDALLGQLRDVDEAVLGAEEVHEGAEVHRSSRPCPRRSGRLSGSA
jgi:hypothetical protein